MRKTIAGMVAAVAVMMTAGTAPASACGGLFTSCSPCAYAAPCAAPVYVAPVAYSGCNSGCGGWAHERLPDPVHQYYHVNQGPTYTGPGNYAPRPVYEEDALPVYPRRHYGHRSYYGHRYSVLPRARYGAGYGYGARHMDHGMRYGAPMRHYGHRAPLRRYY
jgi:hypothetical protein